MPDSLDDKLKQLHLVNAVSSNDTDAILAAIAKINTSPSSSTAATYGSPLHLVVSLCQIDVIEHILTVFCTVESEASKTGRSLEWINIQDQEKETPLHIASRESKLEIIEKLFQLPNLNDTIRDARGHTAEEIANNPDVQELFESKFDRVDSVEYRTEFIIAMTTSMQNAVNCGDHHRLDSLFEGNERALSYLKLGWIDINGPLEIRTERSLLHLAAKGDNIELVAWGLRHLADPNVKDFKGKKPHDLTKSDKIKELLKHAKSQTSIQSASLNQAINTTLNQTHQAPNIILVKDAPVLKGMLSKWTNYREGYQARYFVLEGGVFSYYHDIKDYPATCRGSISTLSADAFFPDSSHDPSRFDVTGGNGSGIKYSMKARSPSDAKKWVWALKESRMWMADASKVQIHHHSRNESISQDHHATLLTRPITGSNEDVNRMDQCQTGSDHGSAGNDLFSFLDNQLDGQSSEMRRFLILLKTEMQVQKETVQSAVELVKQACNSKDHAISNSLQTLPNLLTDSAQHIEALILGIVRYCNKREGVWEQKLGRAHEAQRRMEDIVNQLALDPATAAVATAQLATTTLVANKTKSGYNTSDDEDDEDLFFDAQEGSTSPIAKPDMSLRSVILPVIISEIQVVNTDTVVDTGFLTIDELMESSEGYDSLLPHRRKLPLDPSLPKPALAVWSFLKNAIGKDLSKVTLPVIFNEPISMLQRMCEDIEFIELLSLASRIGSKGRSPTAHLLNQPAKLHATRVGIDYGKFENMEGTEASMNRLLFVSAFAMSNYSSTAGRTNKPFNPMLGETYEVVEKEKHYRYLSEQVCHHPPVSACSCESPDFSFWTEVYVKSKFWGKYLDLHPLGTCHVSLPVYENGKITAEHYSWKKVTTCVNNLIMGTLSIEHYGDMVITNHRTQEQATITFKPKESGGWFGAKESSLGGDVVGEARDANGVAKFEFKGRWDEFLNARSLSTQSEFELWKVNTKPPASFQNFNLTTFGMVLNETSPSLSILLPSTDSRNRPDQRAMEKGQWIEADAEKERCEGRQRGRRKELVALFDGGAGPCGPVAIGLEFGETWWTPRFFCREVDGDTNEGFWRLRKEYWGIRGEVSRGGKWPGYVEDTFGISSR